MEPQNESQSSGRQVIAVLRNVEDAERVAARLVDQGVPDDGIFVDDPRDEARELRAEQHAEAAKSVIAPQAAFIADKQGFRGFWMLSVVLCGAAIVLSFPLALIDFGLSYWWRYLIVAG